MDIDKLLNSSVNETTRGPSFNRKWGSSLSLGLDAEIYNVKIIAYKVRWFNGKWSPWHIPGDDDTYKKNGEPLRRYWACFCDHTHTYLHQPISNQETEEIEETIEEDYRLLA